VKSRRGSRLGEDSTIFSGLFWTGTRGLELGLIDGLGEMRDVIKRRFGKDAKLELIGGTRTLFGRRVPGVALGSANLGEIASGATAGLAEGLEERAMWSRFGL